MTWIKICGITNQEDAWIAVDAGADAIGFVFYEKSPRDIGPEMARKIAEQLPATIEKVGVFVNQTAESICAIADAVGLTAVQLHGDQEDERLTDLIRDRRTSLKVVIGIAMHHSKPEGWAMRWSPESVHAFLVDAGSSTNFGGTGKTFDWQKNQPNVDAIAGLGRVVVAGGLNPGNVGEAIRILKPWGVDVSSGVEAVPRKKDPQKVRAFVEAVRQAGKKN